MKRYLESVKSFAVPTICFIIAIFVVKTFELFSSESLEGFGYMVEMIMSNVIASLIISFCIFIIFNIISLGSKKAALYTSSILFSIVIIAEIGLIFYHKSTGFVMGRELIERPLWETVVTVKSVLNFWMIAAAMLIIVAFTFITAKIAKRQKAKDRGNRGTAVLIVLMLISIPSLFFMEPNQNTNIVNKIWYCIDSCLSKVKNPFVNQLEIEFDNDVVERYKEIFPYREIIDKTYPLERVDNIANVLGPYFKESEKHPDIVFIIVESLGSDFFGQNEFGYTVTPFLDSLSKHSLLWTNCLSTTPRSAGVLPATTASVPHGLKGFQFGDMPDHNSLISILKSNSYNTNVFYAGYFTFDRVHDYLTAQGIDYMSPFAYECEKNKKNNDFDYSTWGYHDMKLYERGLSIINERKDDRPNFDAFITISQHDNGLKLNTNKELQDYYYSKAEKILSSIPSNSRSNLSGKKGFMTAFLYGDDALKYFFTKYNETHKDGNVIFVITGDHSLNLVSSNPLNAYHVPLIIWSPLLKEAKHFHSAVSHNDITPSLTTLLRENFGLKTPQTTHWISDGLDTSVNFRSDIKTYFITPSNESTNCLYDSILYFEKNGKDFLYLVQDGMRLNEIKDDSLLDIMKKRMNTLLYIDNYTYINNRLTKTPIIQPKNYELIESVTIDSVVCHSGKEKPSVSERSLVDIYSKRIGTNYTDIKIVMSAKMKYTSDISHEKFIRLSIRSSNASWTPEAISKNIVEKDYRPDTWCNVNVTKVFRSNNNNKGSHIEIYLRPTEHDHQWDPNHSVILKDINISILGTN